MTSLSPNSSCDGIVSAFSHDPPAPSPVSPEWVTELIVRDVECGEDELVHGEQDPSPNSVWDMECCELKGLALSFPVGPRPRGGRFAGGRLRAVRRLSFSSSSSATRSSSALMYNI